MHAREEYSRNATSASTPFEISNVRRVNDKSTLKAKFDVVTPGVTHYDIRLHISNQSGRHLSSYGQNDDNRWRDFVQFDSDLEAAIIERICARLAADEGGNEC